MPKIYGYTEIIGDILISGSFSILGSASSINTSSLVVSDTIIALGHSQSGSPILDEGLMFVRGIGLTQALIWDESDDTFALIGTNDDHTVVGDINIDSYSNLRVGGLTTSTLKITSGAVDGYYLRSDGSGNSTWVELPGGLTGSGTSNYVPNWTNSNTLSSVSSIYSDGNFVGIGGTTSITTSGSYKAKLQISDGVSGITNSMPVSSTPLVIQSNSSTSVALFSDNSNISQIYFGTPGDEFGAFLRWDYPNRNFILSTGNTSGKIVFQTANGVEAARIDQSGNICIGTTSTSYKLEVLGTVSTTGFRMTNGANSGYVLTSDSSGNATWIAATSASANFANTDLTLTGNRVHNTNGQDLLISNDGTINDIYFNLNSTQLQLGHNIFTGTFNSSKIDFEENVSGHPYPYISRISIDTNETVFNNNSYNRDFRVKGDNDSNLFFIDASTDNIGIGNSTPLYKLQVTGTISTTALRMTNGSTNGYVMSSDSNGVASWTASIRDLSFGHSSITPVVSTTYHIGFLPALQPVTTNQVSRRIRSAYKGEITSVSIMWSMTANGSSESVTYQIHNLTQATSQTITSTAQLTTDAHTTFTLSSPLTVSENDDLQIRWVTPAWVSVPTSVNHVITARLRVY